MADSFTPSVASEVAPAYTPEQEAQLVADGHITKEQVPPSDSPQEELILGKFKTQADLEEAYQSLEKKYSSGDQPKGDLGGLLDQAGEYFNENGNISEDHYQQFDSLGISREYVDRYVNGIQATAEAESAQLLGTIGGEDNFTQMSEWMSESLPEAEINAYNNVVEKGSNEEVAVLLQGMFARYKAATGAGSTTLQGQASVTPTGFRSRGEVMAAINDPQYHTDAAFRADVERKLSITPDTVF